MKNTVVLEMINRGEIEKLKEALEEEIYKDSLSRSGNMKQRYSAMKRFFRYTDESEKECFKYPCTDIEVGFNNYTSFCNRYCFVLTTENIGNMKSFDKKSDYPDIEKFIDFNAESVESVDLSSVIATAKSKGYKYKKSEINSTNGNYFFKYKDSYYAMGLLDKAFGIIDNGEDCKLYYKGELNILLIENEIGIVGIMPVKCFNTEKSYIIVI